MLRVFVLFCLFVSSRGVALVKEGPGPLVRADAAPVVGAGENRELSLDARVPVAIGKLPGSVVVDVKVEFDTHENNFRTWPYPGRTDDGDGGRTDNVGFLKTPWARALGGKAGEERSTRRGSVRLNSIIAEKREWAAWESGLEGVWYMYFPEKAYAFDVYIGRTDMERDNSSQQRRYVWCGVAFQLSASGEPIEARVIETFKDPAGGVPLTNLTIKFTAPEVLVSWGRLVTFTQLQNIWAKAVEELPQDINGMVDINVVKTWLDAEIMALKVL